MTDYKWLEMICVTIVVLSVLFIIWYAWASTHSAIAIWRFEMDNNTLEAIKIMNITN